MIDIAISVFVGYLWYMLIVYIGVSLGYHRYWSHRQFKAGKWFEWLSVFLAIHTGARGPLGWIGVHRLHHAKSDTTDDPHSPLYVPAWQVLTSTWSYKKSVPRKYVADVISNPCIKFYHKYWKIILIFTGVSLFLINPLIFVSLWLMPQILGHLGFGLLNYFGHKNGSSVNRWWINLLAPGEGNHKDHHTYSSP